MGPDFGRGIGDALGCLFWARIGPAFAVGVLATALVLVLR